MYVDICLMRDENDEPFLCIAPAWKAHERDILIVEDDDGNHHKGTVHKVFTTDNESEEYEFIGSVFGEAPDKFRAIEKFYTVGLDWPE